ncbi:hypothetical protein QDW26_gp35 [Microbacterium phage Didgeridoo]|nr:hypothetical protein QDW26_gp35 [Microbacterium phage Didgeridoo]YP_010754014.1 hypothetical protein QDW46_gp35 [Microbacterium phage SansAfet]AVR56743.2 hypothetical protein PBI_DIDGERIDOO_36 [Microbacterium phage Didgeridoo]QFP94325.1 hypothetical protein SEA_SANSAFET_35 [Microbacterium phage SansAfet]
MSMVPHLPSTDPEDHDGVTHRPLQHPDED